MVRPPGESCIRHWPAKTIGTLVGITVHDVGLHVLTGDLRIGRLRSNRIFKSNLFNFNKY